MGIVPRDGTRLMSALYSRPRYIPPRSTDASSYSTRTVWYEYGRRGTCPRVHGHLAKGLHVFRRYEYSTVKLRVLGGLERRDGIFLVSREINLLEALLDRY